MKKEFEAYYSKIWAWILMFFAIIFLFGIIMFSLLSIPVKPLAFIIILSFSVLFLFFIYWFVVTIRKNGVAVVLVDDKLILHKKQFIEIPLMDIVKISIYDGDGSFDISVKTQVKRYRMHCFIKEQRKKKDLLILLLKNKGVQLETVDNINGVN